MKLETICVVGTKQELEKIINQHYYLKKPIYIVTDDNKIYNKETNTFNESLIILKYKKNLFKLQEIINPNEKNNEFHEEDFADKIGTWVVTTKVHSGFINKFEIGTKVKIIGVSYRGYEIENESGSQLIEIGFVI